MYARVHTNSTCARVVCGQGAEIDALLDDSSSNSGGGASYFEGKEVVCFGMGAQAVENCRTALLAGARRAHLVTRRVNRVFSAFFCYLLTLNNDRCGVRRGDKTALSAASVASTYLHLCGGANDTHTQIHT